MAELIHTFTSGRMNKDLDERLVPNGEYRDALNLEIASSDTSQVGAFQNIKGNLELNNKTYNPVTGVRTQWAAADYISALTNPICIGSKADENSDEIYWFIASDNISVIASYNTISKVTSPIVVDTQGILNFKSNFLITGINVLEGMLIWTDNQTEPKKITIKDWVNSTSNFITHSKIYAPDRLFIESDLTVIKKYPLSPPTITAFTTQQKTPDGAIAEVDTITTAVFSETVQGVIVPKTSLSAPITLTWQGQNLPYYNIGDILLLSLADNDPLLTDAVIRVTVDSVIGNANTQTGAVVNILSVGVSSEGITLDPQTFDVTLEQSDAFFEFRFARFGYRYKYKNNEISVFSPFTNPAFIPGAFNYLPKEGYNLGMVNRIRQLAISNFIPSDIPIDVVEVDILYKATNNQNVYIVDSFKPTDSEWNNNSGNGSFNIKNEIITSVVQSNQLLRPYDNLPRKALAQEVTANRLIYANYTQNFNLLTSQGESQQVDISIAVDSKDISTELSNQNVPLGVSIDGESVAQSVKSQRSYQIGVAYIDKYGRTTPVFTGKNASITIPKAQAAQSSTLTATLLNTQAPYYSQSEQFPNFKYYVKETSQEYYNLALDRYYDAEDGNLWLSFPSAERNKIDENSFINLKKEHDSSKPVLEKARYKVIAIENEAPLYLKEKQLSLGLLQNADNGDNTFPVAQGFPIEGGNEIQVFDTDFETTYGAETRTESGLSMRVRSGNAVSNYYKISTFTAGVGTGAQTETRMVSSTAFGPDMSFTSVEPFGRSTQVPGLSLELARTESINKPEFTGRFFVKVNNDAVLRSKIVAAGSAQNDTFSRKALGYLYWLDDNFDDSTNFWRNQFTRSDAQGSGERLFINYGDACGPRYLGIEGGAGSNVINIAYAGGYGRGRNEGINKTNQALLNQLNTSGTLFRFINIGNGKSDPSNQIYQVANSQEQKNTTWDCNDQAFDSYGAGSNQITNWKITFNRIDSQLGLNWNPTNSVDGIDRWATTGSYNNSYIGIEFIQPSEDASNFSSANPAVFETEPKEATELDIYYEVPGSYTKDEHGLEHTLDWFNCYAFGNGVESDRIRDDFNQPVIENGVKASAVLDAPYQEETRSTGLIFSQIFNSTSGVNGLNQFIQAESITKDVNPEYGSIQKLHSRDTNLVTLCENKTMKILANKDALFNADGSSNVTSNRAVLGQTVTFQGEYGIATNPESFAEFGFRMYFTDANRGGVIRLSNDGITDVADYGMHGFYSDNLKLNKKIVGSWDMQRKNYNLSLQTLSPYWQETLGAGKFDRLNKSSLCNQFVNELPTTSTTISFKEDVKGWTSRKVYIPESGAYLNNTYFTFKEGKIWEHDVNPEYNNFYGVGPGDTINRIGEYYESSFNTIFNENPGSIKGFKTFNYSGTESVKYSYGVAGSAINYSLAQIQASSIIPSTVAKTKGWYVNSITTDLQEGQVTEFVEKEGKYFNYVRGLDTFFVDNCDTNVDTKEFNVQGIGKAKAITVDPISGFNVINSLDPNCFEESIKPVLADQSFTTLLNTQKAIQIAGTFTCDDVTFELISDATTGGLVTGFNGLDGSFTFTPTTGYIGSGGNLVVRVCCGSLCSENATISIAVTSPASQSLTVKYTDKFANKLCCLGGEEVVIFIGAGESFDTAQFYSETTLVTRAPVGFYSNDVS